MSSLKTLTTKTTSIPGVREKQVLFSMAIENVKRMQECSPEHLSMSTVGFKLDNEKEEGKQKREKMESTMGMKNLSPDSITIARA